MRSIALPNAQRSAPAITGNINVYFAILNRLPATGHATAKPPAAHLPCVQ